MEYISFLTIFLFIILVILLIVVISSISYSDSSVEKGSKVNSKIKSSKLDPMSVTSIAPNFENSYYYFTTVNITESIGYSVSGKFHNSCISIYDLTQGSRLYSTIYNGGCNLVFTSNLNLTNSLFKLSKNKSYLLPLDNGHEYKIIISNVSNIAIKNLTVNYDISFKPIVYEYPQSVGLTEYDLWDYIRNNNLQEGVRVYPKALMKENLLHVDKISNYKIVLVNGLTNFEINGKVFVKHSEPFIEVLSLNNQKVTINNRDYTPSGKNVHTDYIDFITGPNYLLNKFLNGSEERIINYSNIVNDKIIVLEMI
jgi:hypothetical protein